MKFTFPLSKQNLYRMMRNQWKVCRKRRLLDTGAVRIMNENNLEFVDANEYIAPPKFSFDFSSVVGLVPKEVPKDENHPLYKEQPCYTYRDHSVLLEGLHQALVLTNSVQLEPDTLPKHINSLIDTVSLPNQDELVKRSIQTSLLYDAEQKKLPKRKDPERPAWIFPREYGITDARRNRMLCARLVHLCCLASPGKLSVIQDAPFSVPLLMGEDPVQLEVRADIFMSAANSLPPIEDPAKAKDHHLPELIVSHPVISLEEENFYELRDVFPLKEGAPNSNVHTIMVHFNETEVRNIFETPVSENQMISRSLVKAYAAAMAQARYNYGAAVKDLPRPVVVQCVQTDGRTFHFSVLQLNSTDVDSPLHNMYWSLPPCDLYEDCSYVQAVPTLQGYNPLVFKNLLAFYINS